MKFLRAFAAVATALTISLGTVTPSAAAPLEVPTLDTRTDEARPIDPLDPGAIVDCTTGEVVFFAPEELHQSLTIWDDETGAILMGPLSVPAGEEFAFDPPEGAEWLLITSSNRGYGEPDFVVRINPTTACGEQSPPIVEPGCGTLTVTNPATNDSALGYFWNVDADEYIETGDLWWYPGQSYTLHTEAARVELEFYAGTEFEDIFVEEFVIDQRCGRTPATSSAAPYAPVGQTANVWGTVDGPATIRTQVNIPGRGWSTSQVLPGHDGFYAIPLTYGMHAAGTYSWRVVVTYDDGVQEVLAPFEQERVPRTTVNLSPFVPVGRTANVWGTVDGPAIITTQVYVQGKGWSNSYVGRTKDDGGFVIPLTYGQNKGGTYAWRLVIQHETGMGEVTPTFTHRRVAAPTAHSAGVAPAGTNVNVWGTIDSDDPVKIWTEVYVPGRGWSVSRTATMSGRYVLHLSYGQNIPGTYRFRVGAAYANVGVLYSNEFTFVRTLR